MTIKDIAKESGYAVSTVSRALNGHPDVSEKAKQRIAQVVAERGFVPNSNARRLKRQQGKCIAFLVKGTSNMFFGDMLAELQRLAGDAGYDGVVRYLEEPEDEVLLARQLCAELKPRGLVFLGGDPRNFQRSFQGISTPCVLTTSVDQQLSFPNLSMVGVDDHAAGRLAIDHLIGKGHRRIVIMGGDPNCSGPIQMRLAGCRQSLLEHGIPFTDQTYLQSAFSMDSAYTAMQHYLAEGGRATAVFAMSDTTAVGAVRALLDAGLSVPEDVSVIGFDGTPLARYYNPRLTTLCQPARQIAQTSIQLLLDSIQHQRTGQTVLLQAQLEPGRSVRSLPLL